MRRLALVLLAACGSSPPVARDAEPSTDAPASGLDPRDAPQLRIDDAPRFVRIALRSGETVEGQWIAAHDHDQWTGGEGPDPCGEVTHAIFFRDRASVDPDLDRGFTFVCSRDVVHMDEIESEAESYRDLLWREGICLSPGLLAKAEGEGEESRVLLVDRENYDARDHIAENGYGLFAWDFVRAASNARGTGYCAAGDEDHRASNEAYPIFHRTLLFPIDGAIDGDRSELYFTEPDEVDPPPACDVPLALLGHENTLLANVYGRFVIAIVHLEAGSVVEQPSYALGDVIGKVGNSGWSGYPHVHVSLLWDDSAGPTHREWSVPIEMCAGHVLSSDADRSTPFERRVPRAGEHIGPASFGRDDLE